MYLSVVLLCLLFAGTIDSLGIQCRSCSCPTTPPNILFADKVPTIYTPISSGNYVYQQQPQLGPFQQSPSFLNQQQPYSFYPPNSLILVYYRVKAKSESPVKRYPNVCKSEGVTAHPDDCLKFLRCRLSTTQRVFFYEERSCPPGLAFDSTLESCNYQARVANCGQVQFSSPAPKQTPSSLLPTQTLLTYHNDLPETVKQTDKTEFATTDDSSSPSLYVMDLPHPLSVLDDEKKQDHNNDHEVANSAVPLTSPTGKTEKGADYEKTKTSPPTKSVKKPPRKSSSRKTATKRPEIGTKSSPNRRPIVQQKETIEPARKQTQVETFSIGDSNAKMVMDKEELVEEIAENPIPEEALTYAASGDASNDKLVSEVRYEDEPDAESSEANDTLSV